MQTPQEGAMVDEQQQQQQQHLQQFPRATTNRPDAESQPAGVIGGEQTQPALQRRLRGLLYLACQLPSTPSWISSLFTWLLASFFSLFYNSAITKGHDHRHRDFGLVQRYPDPDDKEATSSAQVDIIALPGLSAWAPKTFEAYNNGQDVSDGCTDWLTDHNMLPTKVPGARVLTYNWESNYKGPRSSVRFAETANNFLLDLHEERKRVGRLKRPIVFVASCFGGLLLAKALVRALERSGPRQQDYNRIADWTVGAIFLGTPFRGSWKFGTENARKQIEFARRNNIEVSPELVEYLRPHNREDAGQSPSPLNESVQRFFEIIRDERFGFPVVCFYECLPTDREAFMKNLPLGYKWNSKSRGQELVVPEESATIDGFEIVPLDCRHNMLWKHSSPKGEAFVRICGRVEDMIEGRQAILWSRARNQESEELIIPRQIKEYIKVGFYDDESSNEHMKQHDVFRTRQLGTCLTFLNSRDFDCWRTSPKASTLLCIGDAGAGKTVVASVAIDCLSNLVKEAKRCALAFLYCEYRFENTKDFAGRPTESAGRQSVIDNYLRCILRQLISPCPYVDDAVETMYKMWKEEQRQPDMDESTTALRYVAESFSEVYVVIDALDECSVGVRRKLLRTLTDLQTDLENESGVRMHLMITSRFDVIDGIELNSQSVQKMYIKASGDDVKLYLKANIGEISDHLAHDAGEAIKQRILDTIAITADGMFLLARLQLWTLSNKITDAEIETALEELSEAYKHSVKGRSPEHVQKTYTEAYHKTMNTINSQPQEVRERVKRALNWILHSPHALTVAQFETVLGFPVKLDRMKCSEDIDCKPFKRILIDCAGLVKEEEQRVRLVHYTTQQYLDGHISAIIPTAYQEIESLQITDSASSKHLMLSCIAYLALDDFGIGPKRRSDDEPLINTATNAHTYEKTLSDEKYLNYKNLGSRKTSEDWEKDYPFHDYAAKNWARYAEELAVNFTEDESAMEIFSRFFGDDRKILAAAKHLGLVHYGYNYSHNTLYGLWSRWRARPHLALHFVTHFGRSDVAKLLLSLSRRASGSKHRIGTATELLCSTDRQGFTPLCLAALQGDCRMLEAFLEYGDAAETGHLSNRGKPLRLAALSGSRKAVELLLEKTLDGAVDAMIVGVKQNDESLVKILLHRRVDPDKEAISRAKKAKSGNTARLLARGMKRGRITDLFNRADSGDLEPLCDLDFEDYDWTRANPGNAMTSFEKFQRQYSMWQRNIEL